MARKNYYPGGVKPLTLKKARALALQEFGTAKGLEKDDHGPVGYYQPNELMTELKREVWRGAVGSAKINEASPNMIDVVTVVPSNVGGFTIREMCILDDDENMIAICNTADAEKVVITSGEVAEMKLTMHITVSNTAVIQFLVDPTVITATKKDLEDHNVSAEAHAGRLALKADAAELSAHTHNAEIHISQDQTQGYDRAIAEIGDHVNDGGAHVQDGERAGWAQTAGTASAALAAAQAATEKVNQQAGQIARLEDGLFSNITGNPFLVTFESLIKSFIKDNYASQRDKGTHFGLDRLEAFMRHYFFSRKAKAEAERRAAGMPPVPVEQGGYANGWVLKCDVGKYFYSIQHEILNEKIRRYRNIPVNGKCIRGFGLPDYAKKATGTAQPPAGKPQEPNGSNDTGGTLALSTGDMVRFAGNTHYSSANAASGTACKPGAAKVTQVAKGAKHPYHLVKESGGGSTVYGWVNAADVSKATGGATTPTMRAGAKVRYSGRLYANSDGGGAGKAVNGTYTVSRVIAGKKCGVLLNGGLGWVPESACVVIG